MRKASIWFLVIAGLGGMLTALSVERHGGGGMSRPDGSIEREPMVWHLGLPDKWVEWESSPNAHAVNVSLVSWSFAILIASVCALCGGVRLILKRSRRAAAAAHRIA